MKIGCQFVIFFLALMFLTTVACQKKTPQIPAQAKAPAEPIPTPLPTEITEEAPPPPKPEPKPEPAKVEEPKQQPAKHHRKKSTQPATATAQANEPNSSATTSNNSAIASGRPPANPANEVPPDTAIAADVSSAELTQQKQTTAQLLEATEKTLHGLQHNLSHDEEEMVTQIRSYLAQSRKATMDGDFERAYNLATKAHLLSDALVKK